MTETKYTFKDFKSDQQVRWCPGCGDIAIMSSIQKAMAEMNIPKEKFAVISGIGCSSRFPYYMSTYGFHGIHGRAGALASGVKIANPELSVWQITGDGDALAIGGNHFIHEIRRNVDLNVILFNNQIYGLTKGQYSPTSQVGKITKTSPYGTVEEPFEPGELVIGARGSFFARCIDANVQMNIDIFKEAEKHRGTSVVEALQNCVIFNDGIYSEITDKQHKADRQIYLEHGKPMIFGANRDKGLILDNFELKVVKIGENGITEKDILIHDAHDEKPYIQLMLVKMKYPEFPVAIGVIRSVKQKTYDLAVHQQIEEVKKLSKIKNMDDLFHSGPTWKIE